MLSIPHFQSITIHFKSNLWESWDRWVIARLRQRAIFPRITRVSLWHSGQKQLTTAAGYGSGCWEFLGFLSQFLGSFLPLISANHLAVQ